MKDRNYGIDLLRIVSMYMVVILHVLGHGGILRNLEVLSVNYCVMWFLEITCYCAVNCYALITGYVTSGSKFKYKRIFYLWLDVLFWRLLLTTIINFIYPDLVGKKDFLYSTFNVLFNSYWYFSSYFALFFFIPFINKLIDVLDKRSFKRLIITIVLVLTFINLLSDSFALNDGYSLVWLIVLYLVGAYIKRYNIGKDIKKVYCFLGIIGAILITFLVKILFLKYSKIVFLSNLSGIFVNYTSFTILGVAVLLVIIFSNIKIDNKYFKRFIKRLAPATFGVYIIHEHSVLKRVFIVDSFVFLCEYEWYKILLLVLLFTFMIYMLCSYVEMIRKFIFKKFNFYIVGDYLYNFVSFFMKKYF